MKSKIEEYKQKLNEYAMSSGAIDDGNTMLVSLIKESGEFIEDVYQAIKDEVIGGDLRNDEKAKQLKRLDKLFGKEKHEKGN